MVFIILVGSLVTASLSIYLYTKKNQYSLALSLPFLSMTLLVGVLFNVMILNNPPLANMGFPLIVAAVLFVAIFILSVFLTPMLTWASFLTLLGTPFLHFELLNGPIAIVLVVGSIFLTWLFGPMLKTLVISLIASSNVGFGLSLLFLPNSNLVILSGTIFFFISFIGVVFLAKEQWIKGINLVRGRFQKQETEIEN